MTTWLFQGNPDVFDIDGYLRSTNPILWQVRQKHLAAKMAEGDRVFMWRAAGSSGALAGVVAAGYILGPPKMMLDDRESEPFWRRKHPGLALRATIRIERVAKRKEFVRREWLLEDPVLKDLRVLKLASETNYEIVTRHVSRLEAVWANTGRDWTDAELTAGLWAYHQTHDRGVSQSPTVVALLIGRTVHAVSQKVMNFLAIDPRDPRVGLSGGRQGQADEDVWDRYFDAKSQALRADQLNGDFNRLWRPRGVSEALPSPRQDHDDPSQREEGQGRDVLRVGHGQGYESDPKVRKAIELRAMHLAEEHYRRQGFTVDVTADRFPFDLRCTRDGTEVRVEVKGTRSDGSTIEMTSAEVENARGTAWRTDLYVVCGLTLLDEGGTVEAVGGEFLIRESWKPEPEDLTPVRYRVRVSS